MQETLRFLTLICSNHSLSYCWEPIIPLLKRIIIGQLLVRNFYPSSDEYRRFAQNKTFMRYLQLGVISCLFFLISCKKNVGYERYPTFNIINATNYKISVDTFPYKRYKDGTPLIIRFNNVKCLINQTESSEHSITNINNFIAEGIDAYTYKFTYTFTEADYNRATTCP